MRIAIHLDEPQMNGVKLRHIDEPQMNNGDERAVRFSTDRMGIGCMARIFHVCVRTRLPLSSVPHVKNTIRLANVKI
jgi:hypothetical protein